MAEAGGADVECEVDKRVELRLGKFDLDELIDAGGGGLDVAHEESFSFILSDGHAGMDAGGVSITDGPEAALVLICGEDISFKKLSEVQAVFAIGEVVDSHVWIFAGSASEDLWESGPGRTAGITLGMGASLSTRDTWTTLRRAGNSPDQGWAEAQNQFTACYCE